MDAEQALLTYWGHSKFRPLQKEIVESILEGKDTLALLPTGGGKSICFQVPGLLLPGMCLVVSPLIALMEDQVLNLKQRGISAYAIRTGQRHHSIYSGRVRRRQGEIFVRIARAVDFALVSGVFALFKGQHVGRR